MVGLWNSTIFPNPPRHGGPYRRANLSWQLEQEEDYIDFPGLGNSDRGARGVTRYRDYEAAFLFLLTVLGVVLLVVLLLILLQEGKVFVRWVLRTRRALSRPPSYNTVTKPPRYSLCVVAPHHQSLESLEPDPPSYTEVQYSENTTERRNRKHRAAMQGAVETRVIADVCLYPALQHYRTEGEDSGSYQGVAESYLNYPSTLELRLPTLTAYRRCDTEPDLLESRHTQTGQGGNTVCQSLFRLNCPDLHGHHPGRSLEPGARSQVVTCRSLAVLGHRGEGQEDAKRKSASLQIFRQESVSSSCESLSAPLLASAASLAVSSDQE